MKSLISKAEETLEKRESDGLLRQVTTFESVSATKLSTALPMVNFSSNDYLGLASDFDLLEMQQQSVGQIGSSSCLSSGAQSSPLVVGSSSIHNVLVNNLKDYLNVPESHDVLLFSSGFAANQGVLNTLYSDLLKKGALLQDKLNHASLLDAGLRLHKAGLAKQYRFEHNDVASLAMLFNKLNDSDVACEPDAKINAIQPLLVTEGIFSMDGDAAPLRAMADLCRNHNALLMVDDAHGIGFHKSSLHRAQVGFSDIDIYIGTFGKALGAQGAALIASKTLIKYFINFCKEYIYSTHLSPIQAGAVNFNLTKLMADEDDIEQSRLSQLQKNISLFKTKAQEHQLNLLPSDSAIQPILVGDEKLAMQVSDNLKQAGFYVNAMRYPTVKKGQSRLRVTISAKHDANIINNLVEEIDRAVKHCDNDEPIHPIASKTKNSTVNVKSLIVEPDKVAKHFGNSAASYLNHAQLQFDVGAKLVSALTSELEEGYTNTSQSMHNRKKAGIDLGCGPGLYFDALDDLTETLINVDLSEKMLNAHAAKKHKLCANSASMPIQSGTIDWVYSNLMLQWCDIADVVAEIHRCLKPGGVAVLSTLLPGSLNELATAWSQVDDDQHIHDYQSDEQVRSAITFNNWHTSKSHDLELTYWYDSVKSIARELKGLGANYVEKRDNKGLMGKSKWQAMEKSYRNQFYCTQQQAFPLTYQTRIIILRKAF